MSEAREIVSHNASIVCEPKKTVVCAFGRFQPPTKGHKKMVTLVHEVAAQRKGDPIIFVSPTEDKKGTNPLSWEDRKDMLWKTMPWANVAHDKVRDPWKLIDWLVDEGYTDVYLIAGSDRYAEYTERWLGYALAHFSTVGVLDAGERDPDHGGVEGMSATKARACAVAGDFEGFKLAVGWEEQDALNIYEVLRKKLGV